MAVWAFAKQYINNYIYNYLRSIFIAILSYIIKMLQMFQKMTNK